MSGGDIQSLLDLYSGDIQWQLPELEHVPFSGKRTGRVSVGEFFSLVADAQDVLQFEPQEFIAQGDKVVVLGHYSWRAKATGREYNADFAHVVTIKGGKITSFREYMDTAAASRAHAMS